MYIFVRANDVKLTNLRGESGSTQTTVNELVFWVAVIQPSFHLMCVFCCVSSIWFPLVRLARINICEKIQTVCISFPVPSQLAMKCPRIAIEPESHTFVGWIYILLKHLSSVISWYSNRPVDFSEVTVTGWGVDPRYVSFPVEKRLAPDRLIAAGVEHQASRDCTWQLNMEKHQTSNTRP